MQLNQISWRRGWDSNPRARFWQARRFRGAPVMTTSVPLRENYALESRAIESLENSWRRLNDSAAQRLDDPTARWRPDPLFRSPRRRRKNSLRIDEQSSARIPCAISTW